MSNMEVGFNRRKEFADYCESVYQDESISKKQITDRLGVKCKREFKHLGIEAKRVKVADRSGWHFELSKEREGQIHSVSKVLGEYRDAILALRMKHHNIDENLDRACSHLAEYIPGISQSLSPSLPLTTLRNNLKRLLKDERRPVVKRALREIRIEHHAYYLLQDAYEWSRKESTKNDKQILKEKVKNQKSVNPEHIIAMAEQLLVTSLDSGLNADKASLAIGIALATGRRRTEIMKTGHFQITETTPENHVMFSGQLKTKDRKLFDDVKPYPIPCLVEPQLVVDGLALLRKLQQKDTVRYKDARGNIVVLKENGKTVVNNDGEPVTDIPVLGRGIDDKYHSKAVSWFYSKMLNDRFKSLFNNPMLEFRFTRDIYGAVTYPKYKRQNEGESVYRTRVYGHAGEAQSHYEKFYLDDEIDGICIPDDQQEKQTQYASGMVQALEKLDGTVNAHIRSPNMAIIHAWVKDELKKGLDPELITPSYIRRFCLINGKKLNFNTVKTWYDADDSEAVTVNYPALLGAYGKKKANINAGRPAAKKPETQDDKKNVSQRAEKPKISARKADGHWLVDIDDGVDSFSVSVEQADSMPAAMRQAWGCYEAFKVTELLPEKMPDPDIKKLISGDISLTVSINGMTVVDITGKGPQSYLMKRAIQLYDEVKDDYLKKHSGKLLRNNV
ncbi:MAG: hypothetical protein SwStaBPW_28380 [Shewanella algae]